MYKIKYEYENQICMSLDGKNNSAPIKYFNINPFIDVKDIANALADTFAHNSS